MTQVVARLDAQLLDELDALVERGVVGSRSEAIRLAIERLVDSERRSEIGRQILAGYERVPMSDEELDEASALTVAMIAEEPW